MVYLHNKTVDEVTKKYIEDMKREIISTVQGKFRQLKHNVEERLAVMENNIRNMSNISIPEKCDEYIKDRMSIVRANFH